MLLFDTSFPQGYIHLHSFSPKTMASETTRAERVKPLIDAVLQKSNPISAEMSGATGIPFGMKNRDDILAHFLHASRANQRAMMDRFQVVESIKAYDIPKKNEPPVDEGSQNLAGSNPLETYRELFRFGRAHGELSPHEVIEKYTRVNGPPSQDQEWAIRDGIYNEWSPPAE